MKRRLTVMLGLQSLGLLFACGAAGFAGLVSFGGLGGAAMGVAPEFTFGLVADYVCPEGTSLEYYSVRRSYHRPGESEPHVECVAADGTRTSALGRAIAVVLGLAFLTCFAPVFMPAALLALALPVVITLAWRRRSTYGPAPPFPGA